MTLRIKRLNTNVMNLKKKKVISFNKKILETVMDVLFNVAFLFIF